MSNNKHGGAAYPTTTVLIQGEIIKARGSKYFNFKGKRHLIANYLQTRTTNEPGSLQTVNSDDETPGIKNNEKEMSNGDVTQTVKTKSNSFHMGSVVRQNADGGFTIYESEKNAPPVMLHAPQHIKTEPILDESKQTQEINKSSEYTTKSGIMDMITDHPIIVSVLGTVLGGLALKYATAHVDNSTTKNKPGAENDW